VPRRRPDANPPPGYDIGRFPPFAVTVDIVVLTVVRRDLHVVLIERHGEPYAGSWALPGGFKTPDETLDDAAARELREEAGIESPGRLLQFGTYGDPGRDPRGNVVSVAYLAAGPDVPDLVAGSDAADARLWPVADVVGEAVPLAFDHHRILLDALATAEARLQDSDLATAFVGPEFTLSELRSVYEAVWREPLDAANFRRSLALDSPDQAYAAPLGITAEPGPEGGRPPERYRATENWTTGSPVRRPRRKGPSAPRPNPGAR
jgi:8-oxo-dGTP diphosphatase